MVGQPVCCTRFYLDRVSGSIRCPSCVFPSLRHFQEGLDKAEISGVITEKRRPGFMEDAHELGLEVIIGCSTCHVKPDYSSILDETRSVNSPKSIVPLLRMHWLEWFDVPLRSRNGQGLIGTRRAYLYWVAIRGGPSRVRKMLNHVHAYGPLSDTTSFRELWANKGHRSHDTELHISF